MVQYANRMDLLKGSEIRELLALTSKPDIISFAGGMPAPELFLVKALNRLVSKLWTKLVRLLCSIHPQKVCLLCVKNWLLE